MNQALKIMDGLRRRDVTGRDKPDMRRFGLSPDFKLIERNELWKFGDKIDEMPKSAHCAAAALAADGKLACVNIEHFPIDPWHVANPSTNAEQYVDHPAAERNRNVLTAIIDEMHAANPGLSLGYFNLMPLFHWAALEDPEMPEDHPRYVAWQQQNASMRRRKNEKTGEDEPRGLADAVNAIYPQCYANHPDMKLWEAQTRRQVVEARKYEKPVFPFIVPFYLTGKLPTGQPLPIDGPTMIHQLDVLHDCEVDGAVLFGHLNLRSDWWAALINWLTGK